MDIQQVVDSSQKFQILGILTIVLIVILIILIIYTGYTISNREIRANQFLITNVMEPGVGIGTTSR